MNKIVMVVEDNESILDMIQLFLEEEGYTIITAMEGTKVLKVATEKKPDMILLDMWIPGLDGIEVAKTLRSNLGTKNIPIVMVSAHPSAELIAQQAGVNQLLPKPFDLTDLLSVVKKYTT